MNGPETENLRHGVNGNGHQGTAGVNLDLTVPDTARIMDFWLGGSHHFEVDRAMARKIEKMTPIAPHWGRIARQFLGRVVSYLFYEEHHRNFLVAGAGLPTCGNVHEVAPEARVLYSDINPITAAYGRHILGDNPRAAYIKHDARYLHTLDSPELQTLFGGSRRVALIYIGLLYFFPDEVLKQTMLDCYNWVAPGSCLALTQLGEDSLRYAAPSVEAYFRMGRPLFPRTMRETEALLPPWVLSRHGVKAASHWGLGDVTEPSPPVYAYGCLTYKPE